MSMKTRIIATALGCLFTSTILAQTGAVRPAAAGEEPAKVVASGTLPDEASRAAILGKLRDLYGAANVVDRLEVGGVVPPPNWTEHMGKLLNANLKEVHKGQMQVNGTQIAIKGNVANEVLRQQVVSDMATALNPTYTVDNGLVVVAAAAQNVLDKTLSNRVVEFESGSATLTLAGRAILDEMATAIKKIGTPSVQVIGHTDSVGNRLANIGLSLSRANTVRTYLIDKGIPAESLSAVGSGPDHPVTTNDTVEGRAKNRRIEFRLAG
ncbi:MAG: OmpA family protein [Dechloromonas sp.]|nr:OmpA family protein [Dechloromonas sp.]